MDFWVGHFHLPATRSRFGSEADGFGGIAISISRSTEISSANEKKALSLSGQRLWHVCCKYSIVNIR